MLKSLEINTDSLEKAGNYQSSQMNEFFLKDSDI